MYQTNRIIVCASTRLSNFIAGRLHLCISNTCNARHNYIIDYNRCGITRKYARLQISIWNILTILEIQFQFAVRRLQRVRHSHCIP